MNNTTFYLKYRPQTLEELDLDSVRGELKKIVSSGNIPHALLFAGTKGTGKTSAARIIAKIVNCEKQGKKLSEPCNKCGQCKSISNGNNLDVIELDAASNRGIDDIRALRDTIKLSPAYAKKKVYIIDEAHMLTLEASNALLKTLEEPPDHVLFILATTNPEKLIETIRSRTTLIEFHKASSEETVRSLTFVVKGEKLKIDKEILLSISKMSDGSFRDAVKTLEQLVSQKVKLEKESVEEYLFNKKAFNQKEFIDNLLAKDSKKALLEIGEFIKKGVSTESIIDSLVSALRESLLVKVGLKGEEIPNLPKQDLISLIELLIYARSQIALSPIEELPLEIAVIRWCGDGVAEEPQTEDVKQPTRNLTTKLSEITDDVWKTILTTIRPINTSIEALLRAARPVSYDGSNLTLGVYYRFHKERLEEVSHRKILEDVLASILGSPIKVTCTLTDPPAKKVADVPLTETKDNDIIKIAEEIFGN
ncbi:MAG: DNA polymerase III subunit gamma/tau [Candidatus Woesebacteria bacterium]|nr:DNA polymerase III subunit gamma/tau [Candidatus Woesebacteria bacterium]